MFGWFGKKKDTGKPKQSEPVIPKGPVLDILDACAKAYTFPMLDNGYHYLAAARLTAFHGENGWALVFEIFDFSHRAGFPGLSIHTFSNMPTNRKIPPDDKTQEDWEQYVAVNPHNESKTFWHIENRDWLENDDIEYVKPHGHVGLRGKEISLPDIEAYKPSGIKLEEDRPLTFEFCRYLATHHRDDVLATEPERRSNIPHDLKPVLTLEDWTHIDLADGELPSDSETFRQLEQVLLTGDVSHYQMHGDGNTHWSNWPDGGTL